MARRNARRSAKKGKPAWVWFLLGNFVGGFAVFILFLSDLKQAQPVASNKTAKAESRQPVAQPKFDFYTLLKETEVPVPESSAPARPRPSTPKPARVASEPERTRLAPSTTSLANSRNAAAAPSPAPSSAEALVYVLQAASFKSAQDAQRLRAELSLSNLDVSIEAANVAGGTRHRVLVGPYASSDEVARARTVLARHQLKPLVLKRPAG